MSFWELTSGALSLKVNKDLKLLRQILICGSRGCLGSTQCTPSERYTLWARMVENKKKYEQWISSLCCLVKEKKQKTLDCPKACLRLAKSCNSISSLQHLEEPRLLGWTLQFPVSRQTLKWIVLAVSFLPQKYSLFPPRFLQCDSTLCGLHCCPDYSDLWHQLARMSKLVLTARRSIISPFRAARDGVCLDLDMLVLSLPADLSVFIRDILTQVWRGQVWRIQFDVAAEKWIFVMYNHLN